MKQNYISISITKKQSQFDGVVGVLPDNSNPGKVNLTADAHLKLSEFVEARRGDRNYLEGACPGKRKTCKCMALIRLF